MYYTTNHSEIKMKKLLNTFMQHPTHFILLLSTHLLLIILITYCIITNIFNIFSPTKFNYNTSESSNNKSTLESIYNSGTRYISCTIPHLYYSGYDSSEIGKVTGHYYYSLDADSCTIFLLSTKMFDDNDNLPLELTDISFTANLSKNDTNLKQLIRNISTDINWNYYSLSQCCGSIVVDEEGCSIKLACLFIGISILLAIINLVQIKILYDLIKQKR